MAQLLVRQIDDTVKQRLVARARAKGRSVEAEARDILAAAVAKDEPGPTLGLAAKLLAIVGDKGLTDEEADWINSQRYLDRPVRTPPDFME